MASASHPALDLRFAPGPGAGSLQDFLYAELDTYEPTAILEHEAGDGWRVFFRTRAQRDAARVALQAEFRSALLDLSSVDVADDDWARRSQANLTAVRAGRIVVAPPWDVPLAGRTTEGDIVIVIEPSMGFGTGHHATTRLCLQLLQDVDVAGRSVIDVGTGSGVLAIAAVKLGAAAVLALDHDPNALVSARENVVNNGAIAVDVREGDVSGFESAPADVVLANLTGAALRRSAAALDRLTARGGVLIVSGFAPEELRDVSSAFAFETIRERFEGEWAAASLRK